MLFENGRMPSGEFRPEQCSYGRPSVAHFAAAFCGAKQGLVKDFFQLVQTIALHAAVMKNQMCPGRTADNAAGMKVRAMTSHATVLVGLRPVVV